MSLIEAGQTIEAARREMIRTVAELLRDYEQVTGPDNLFRHGFDIAVTFGRSQITCRECRHDLDAALVAVQMVKTELDTQGEDRNAENENRFAVN